MSDQAVTQSPSLEERIGNIVDPSDDQSAGQEEQQVAEGNTEPEFEEVEYEGEKFRVPPKLKKGLMLNDDYTRKTQELSEHRSRVELAQKQLKLAEQQNAFRREVSGDYEQVAMIDAYLKQPVDWGSMPTEDLLRRRAEVDQLKDRRAELQNSLSQRERQFVDEITRQQQELIKESKSVLARKIPGWDAAVEKSVSDWALTQGFTSEELNSITNPVHNETLWKASQYDKLVANKNAAVSQASKASPMVAPGSSNPMPQNVKDKLNFRKQLGKLAPTDPQRRRLVEERAGSIFSR